MSVRRVLLPLSLLLLGATPMADEQRRLNEARREAAEAAAAAERAAAVRAAERAAALAEAPAPAAEETLRPWDTGPMRLARTVLGARRRPADRVPARV